MAYVNKMKNYIIFIMKNYWRNTIIMSIVNVLGIIPGLLVSFLIKFMFGEFYMLFFMLYGLAYLIIRLSLKGVVENLLSD